MKKMLDVLSTYELPLNPEKLAVCINERPVQLFKPVWDPVPAKKPGEIKKDYAYLRGGVVNGFWVKHFDKRKGASLWRRFTVHNTPHHGSCLNQAEIEIGMSSRQCLEKSRIPLMEPREEKKRLGIGMHT
jgi:hypothetical protein